MPGVRKGVVLIAAGAALMLGGGGARAADDDLAVVKRATAGARQATPEAEKAEPAPTRKAPSPQWLKVRIAEKNGKRSRVSINLPLALVHALGDDCPIDWHGKASRDGERRRVRLSEVLKALEAGQQIVEVDDEGATVRVWVE